MGAAGKDRHSTARHLFAATGPPKSPAATSGFHRFGLSGRSHLAVGIGARISRPFTGCIGRLGGQRFCKKRAGPIRKGEIGAQLVIVPVILLLSPLTAAVIIGMHLTAGIVEYTVKKPRLNPISFLLFFTLEQASYQSGVWWECIQRVSFNPLLPRIIHKRI